MADSSELQPQAPVPKPRPRRARSGMIASATGPQQQTGSAERRRGASESGEYIHILLYCTQFGLLTVLRSMVLYVRTKFCLSLC